MPELPEVQTTASGLDGVVRNLTIVDVWTDYNSPYFHGSQTIKDPSYFISFRRKVKGAKILRVRRRAKNVLIDLSGDMTILIHMKMTGHLLYGDYDRSDPYNRFIHFIIYLSNGKNIELSDTRKFAKVTLLSTSELETHFQDVGPEPLEDSFGFAVFLERISLRQKNKIKPVLMDQSIIAGVGNIYADESLWRAGIHPETNVQKIQKSELKKLYTALRTTLLRGIDFGGDSMSDYRNIHGKRGSFQEKHNAYQRAGEKCSKNGCKGYIQRIVVAGRGTHFCPEHQKK